jgi:hypothetical protein
MGTVERLFRGVLAILAVGYVLGAPDTQKSAEGREWVSPDLASQ